MDVAGHLSLATPKRARRLVKPWDGGRDKLPEEVHGRNSKSEFDVV